MSGASYPCPAGLPVASWEQLGEVLVDAHRRGFIGSASWSGCAGDGETAGVHAHARHALGFAKALELVAGRVIATVGQSAGWSFASQAVDLGSGGGLPALALAALWPDSRWCLVESMNRRAEFLRHAVARLNVGDRVTVYRERAEFLGRDPAWRGRVDLVTARSFGPPAVVSECAAPLLDIGGWLVVSEPPDSRGDRWAPSGLDDLGLRLAGVVQVDLLEMRAPNDLLDRHTAAYAVLRQVAACPERFPRRPGIPGKRPWFG